MNQKTYYLIDTCALIHYFDNQGKTIKYSILDDVANEIAFYYIPQFCVAEVFNVFAKLHYRTKKFTKEAYSSIVESFKYMIKNREILYAYDLHRYHNINCDLIYKIEQTTPQAKNQKGQTSAKPHLSTCDILIIAMAIELDRIHGKGNVSILSRDGRLIDIAKKVGVNAIWYK